MAEGLAPQVEARVGRALIVIARWMAYFGGVILTAMAVLTVISIIGRALIPLGLRNITGDYELVEMGCAIAVFSFLPWCQLNRGHVTVDILVEKFPARLRIFLGLVGDVLLTIVAGVIAWRLWLGMGEKTPFFSQELRDVIGFGYKPFSPETSYELQIPVWIPYLMSWLGAAFFCLVCLYTVWRSLNWTLRGQEGAVA